MTSRFIAALAILAAAQTTTAQTFSHIFETTNHAGQPIERMETSADVAGNSVMKVIDLDENGDPVGDGDRITYKVLTNSVVMNSGPHCEEFEIDGDTLPGGVNRDEMAGMMAEMEAALAEMKAQDPQMAAMLEQQMGSQMAALMGGNEQPTINIVNTGNEMEMAGYDTTAFAISGMPGADATVWAADIDDVEGAEVISEANRGMMQAFKQMMNDMGMGDMFDGNPFAAIMEVMEDFYPIVTQDSRGTTTLVSTTGSGPVDFGVVCP